MIIRHGRTQGNAERRYIGARTDEHVLDSEKRALAVQEDFDGERVIIATSPMRRAVETAQIMFPSVIRHGSGLHMLEELRETDFGLFEGSTHEELSADPACRDIYQAWIDSGAEMAIPGGESAKEARARSMAGLHKAVRLAVDERAEVLIVVAHGGTVMAVMSSLFQGGFYDYHVDNGDGYEFDVEVNDAGDFAVAGTYDRFCGRISA